MRAEAELVLCAARSGAGTKQADDRLVSLLQKDLNWQAVANLATRNGVLPLVYRRLSALVTERSLPPLPERFNTLFRVNAVRSQHLTAELLRLLSLLEGQGVATIPFKGPALAVLLYGDILMRQFGDLDLLVRRQDVLRVAEVLLAAGYRTAFDCREALKTRFFDAYENQFISPKSRITIDVHWGVMPGSLPFGPNFDRMWMRTEQVDFNGMRVRSLALRDLLHVLCLHGCRDGWDKLSSAQTIAGLIERIRDQRELNLLIEEAVEARTHRMVLLGLCLANRWMKTPLPPHLAEMIRADRAVEWLAEKIGAGFFIYGNRRKAIQHWVQQLIVPLGVIDTNRDYLRYCLMRAVRPTLRDGEFVRLPKPLFPLYYVLRPVRLLFSAAKELARRLPR
jgi:hypothetical protein